MTMRAALLTLPMNDYRQTLERILAESERRFDEKIADFYRNLTKIFGYRLKDADGGFGFLSLQYLEALLWKVRYLPPV